MEKPFRRRVFVGLLAFKIIMLPVLDNRSLVNGVADNITDKGRAYPLPFAVTVPVLVKYLRAAVRSIAAGRKLENQLYHFRFLLVYHNAFIRHLFKSICMVCKYKAFPLLLPVFMGIVNLLAQLPAVFLRQNSLDSGNQRIIRRIKLAFQVHIKALPVPLHPVEEQIPVFCVPHKPILAFDNYHIESVAFQVLVKPVIFIAAFHRSAAFGFHIGIHQFPSLLMDTAF